MTGPGALLPLPTPTAFMLSIVVPVYNEEASLPTMHRRLSEVIAGMQGSVEIVFVDDGSRDRSAQLLQEIHAKDPRVSVVRFSRNFGKEPAVSAGLHAARGEAVIVMDGDLQHPPEMLPAMVEAWRAGADVVNMRRRSRADESWIKRQAAGSFYSMINKLSDIPIPADVGDFRLFSRRAVDALNRMPERNRFMKGLFAWIGFDQVTLEYDVGARLAGETKWRLRQLWHFAIEGITAFSVAPLKVASKIGLVAALLSFAFGLYFLARAMVFGDPVPGFPTLIVVVSMLGGLQLLAIGVLGEYLGRLSLESKQRPLYLVQSYLPAAVPAAVAVEQGDA